MDRPYGFYLIESEDLIYPFMQGLVQHPLIQSTLMERFQHYRDPILAEAFYQIFGSMDPVFSLFWSNLQDENRVQKFVALNALAHHSDFCIWFEQIFWELAYRTWMKLFQYGFFKRECTILFEKYESTYLMVRVYHAV